MLEPPPHLASLLAAVRAAPEDHALRLHVSTELLEHGMATAALEHCSAVLAADSGNAEAVALLGRITAAVSAAPAEPTAEPIAEPTAEPTGLTALAELDPPEPVQSAAPESPDAPGFDWVAAERQVRDSVEPRTDPVLEDIETSRVTLADVAGMEQVKQRLEVAFLGPLRRPELAKAFGKSTTGGLLLYGPPGCGKTFIARALAGQLGAKFFPVGIADVLDAYTGDRERHIAETFAAARRNAPCVLFFDEVDALGQKRSHLRYDSWLRTVVNTLLSEMDSVSARNDGVFVLGATNQPWDVDPALRRPGRFDRMVLVLPPDAPAREALLTRALRDRPVAGIDLDRLVESTMDFSGADLAHLVDSAAELALADSMVRGTVRPIGMADFTAALREVRPSTGPWLQSARNVTAFNNTDGTYDDLLAYLRQRRMA